MKVETNGAAGLRNALTDEEIRRCDGIIVAADTAVDVDRFRGRPVIFVPVSEAIRRPAKLLQLAVSGEVQNYEGGASFRQHSVKRIAHTVYSHMMNGVSHMLPDVYKRQVQRFFVIDSMALANVTRRHDACRPDFIEILPGVMPKIIRRICQETQTPIIAGGLVSDKEDIMAALGAGACAVSTTNPEVWRM